MDYRADSEMCQRDLNKNDMQQVVTLLKLKLEESFELFQSSDSASSVHQLIPD